MCGAFGPLGACVESGSWQSGGGAACEGSGSHANGWVGARVQGPFGYRFVGVDNGCYHFTDYDGGPSQGTYLGATYDDGTGPSDHLRRAHVNTGEHESPSGETFEYCHAGVFNGRWDYIRVADCPASLRVPLVLTMLP